MVPPYQYCPLLSQGSQGLKAVTKAKLKYEPLELDPEDMVLSPSHLSAS